MKLVKIFYISFWILFSCVYVMGQMPGPNGATLYGNEWIDYEQTYYKIPVGADGWKKISYSQLVDAGVNMSNASGNSWRLYHNGKEVPIQVSTTGQFQSEDYILFYGEQNRSQQEQFMFQNPQRWVLNPEYSLFSDTSVYYLMADESGNGLRYQLSNSGGMSPIPVATVNRTLTTVYSSKHYTDAYSMVFDPDFYDLEGFALPFAQVVRANVALPKIESIATDSVYVEIGLGLGLTTREADLYIQEKKILRIINERSQSAKILTVRLAKSEILENNLAIRIQCDESTEQATIAYVKIKYESLASSLGSDIAENFGLRRADGTYSLQFSTQSEGNLLYDIGNGRVYAGTSIEGGNLTYHVEKNGQSIFNFANQVSPVKRLTKVKFDNYLTEDFNYVIITHSYFNQEVDGLNSIDEYVAYRASSIGGGYKVKVVEIEQLTDQFMYGIEGHPYAIRNFIHKTKQDNIPLQFVNIIGKGVSYSVMRAESNYQKYNKTLHFIPTFGFYGSDNLLAATSDSPVPTVAIGRVPVVDHKEILIYLDKLKAYDEARTSYETMEDRKWVKKILHFNGGDRSIYSIIANSMDNNGKLIEQDSFAANVISYYKSSFGTDESPEQDEIVRQINEGSALMTFLGHSASSALDFDIDNIGEYQNKGKLPIFVALGCSSGNIFLPSKNLAEIFVLTEDVGSVAFLSTSSSEYLHTLQNFAKTFYQQFGGEMYGQPVGQVVAKSHELIGLSHRHLISVFTYCGDPAIRSYSSEGPDFTFNDKEISIAPTSPSLVNEKIDMTVNVENLGVRHNTPIKIAVDIQFPNGQMAPVDTVEFIASKYKTEVTFQIPMLDNMEGLNVVQLTLDPKNEIKEFPNTAGEQNNQLYSEGKLGFEIYVRNTSIQLTYPFNDAIIPNNNPVFTFFNGNIGNKEQQYQLEIDTIPSFDSPFYKMIEKRSDLAQISVNSPVVLEEEVVYYWRVREVIDSAFSMTNAFIYIDQQTGWNQSHFGQFQNDSLYQVDIASQKWAFALKQNLLELGHGNQKAYSTYNGEGGPLLSRMYPPCINVSIFKPHLNDFVGNPYPGLYNSTHVIERDAELKTFVFVTRNKLQRTSLIDLIQNEAEEGDIVLVWNSTEGTSPMGETWALDSVDNNGLNLFNFFESKGANLVRQLAKEDRRTYTLMYREGGEIILESLLDSGTFFLENLYFPAPYDVGSITTSDISILQSISQVDLDSEITEDSDWITYRGLFTQSNETLVEEVWEQNSPQNISLTIPNLKNFRFDANLTDPALRSIPRINHWRVFGEFKHDLSISNAANTPFVDLPELKKRKLKIAYQLFGFDNIAVDSISIEFEIIAQNTSWKQRKVLAVSEISANQNEILDLPDEVYSDFIFKITVDSDQKIEEALETNNSILTIVPIEKDVTPPVIDVTFDNRYIFNGDIVSPNSTIVAEVKEVGVNNIKQPLDYTFYILSPDGNRTTITEDDPKFEVEYQEDKILLKYQSEFTEQGIYTLQVSAKDNFGNAPEVDYQVDFEIILEASISRILPYPNPFVNSMRFAYTLTGTEEPEYFAILIYTPSGRLVKEISKQEFGPMEIGQHLSSYVWDGKDNYHQDLAPGLYLYKVIVRDKEKADYKQYQIQELEANNYFKNNIGKIVKLK